MTCCSSEMAPGSGTGPWVPVSTSGGGRWGALATGSRTFFASSWDRCRLAYKVSNYFKPDALRGTRSIPRHDGHPEEREHDQDAQAWKEFSYGA